MKTLKEFFSFEGTWINLPILAVTILVPIVFILALKSNEHPTNEQVFCCWFFVVLFAILAGFMIWITIDDFRNRVR